MTAPIPAEPPPSALAPDERSRAELAAARGAIDVLRELAAAAAGRGEVQPEEGPKERAQAVEAA